MYAKRRIHLKDSGLFNGTVKLQQGQEPTNHYNH